MFTLSDNLSNLYDDIFNNSDTLKTHFAEMKEQSTLTYEPCGKVYLNVASNPYIYDYITSFMNNQSTDEQKDKVISIIRQIEKELKVTLEFNDISQMNIDKDFMIFTAYSPFIKSVFAIHTNPLYKRNDDIIDMSETRFYQTLTKLEDEFAYCYEPSTYIIIKDNKFNDIIYKDENLTDEDKKYIVDKIKEIEEKSNVLLTLWQPNDEKTETYATVWKKVRKLCEYNHKTFNSLPEPRDTDIDKSVFETSFADVASSTFADYIINQVKDNIQKKQEKDNVIEKDGIIYELTEEEFIEEEESLGVAFEEDRFQDVEDEEEREMLRRFMN